MSSDLSVFWRNNEHAYALFQDLLARSEQGTYDDNFLAQLAAYRAASPISERADVFAARYLLAQGDAEGAVICGERAYAKRPVNLEVWRVLSAAYQGVGRELDAVTMQGYIQGLYPDEEFQLTLPKESQKAFLDRFSMGVNNTCYAPLIADRAFIENGQLHFDFDIFLGEEIPQTIPPESTNFWVGTYIDEGFLSAMSTSYEMLRHQTEFIMSNRDVTFDIQKAREVTGTIRLEIPEGSSAIVPIAGTYPNQGFIIQTNTNEYPGNLGKWAFSYFRFDKSVTLHSSAPYAIGTPIPLGHSPNRKKLVLNILVDALCWPATRELFTSHMPRIAKFFSHGVIFDQHFSTSEHTLPALSAIETGRYPHHTHIFNGKDTHELPLAIKPVSECMKELGYYCSAPLVSGHSLYYGTYRGYDRLIATYVFQPTYEGTERIIRSLDALTDVDHFMFCHTTDIHPLNIQVPLKFSTAVEIKMPLAERFVELDSNTPSVRTPQLPIYLEQFYTNLRKVDRNIGDLLSYIEEHYDEDEYIVNLYSDHGAGLYDPHPLSKEIDLASEYVTAATWMMRGAGIPEGVVVHDLTSAVDIYPTLGTLCGFPVAADIDGRLPAILGGAARDSIYSASMFPGQTYKLAVRTHDHVLRLETREPVDEDGTVDFAAATVGIYPRGHELDPAYKIDSEELRAFFYPRARDFVQEIANNGEFWPEMRAARPEWFRAND